ncbi:hypothetical protein [Sorangium sp. So ce1151]|uniref:hypothetical protein n=1 Tax=Sorangium sp. So ce1151 TaxID=3133332 RepID=UPI003F644546
MRHRCLALVALPAATAALSAACSFPDVVFTDPSSAGGGGASATASSEAAGGGGGTAASGGGGSGGSGGATSGSGSGGSGGATSGSASGTGGGGGVNCDVDGDGYPSTGCEGGTDCNDDNADVHPDQANTFHDKPIRPGGGFDYDCSGEEEPQIPSVYCQAGGPCRDASNVYLLDVACGDPGPVGSCNLLCQQDVMYDGLKRACH